MKVCIVVPYFTPFVRGNEYGLAVALMKLGYDITIVTSTGKAPREIKNELLHNNSNLKVKYLPTLVNVGDNPITKGFNVKDYDLVLIQEDYPFICHKAFTAAKKNGVKTILSSERTYYPSGFKKSVLRLLDKTKNREIRENVDVLTAHCSAARSFMQKELKVRRKIRVINVGVDTGLFRPMKQTEGYLSPKEGTVKLLTVARLHKYKGLEYLIEAMSLLKNKMPEAILYILGNGKEELNLKNLVNKLELSSMIVFIQEPVPNEKMPLLYNECDIYVQPSVIEPYGIAVLEAMSCGKAVIGTKVGGMLDTIKDYETGILVEPMSPTELARAIIFLSDEKLRVKMGLRARDVTVDNFEWMKIGKMYQDIFEELLSPNTEI